MVQLCDRQFTRDERQRRQLVPKPQRDVSESHLLQFLAQAEAKVRSSGVGRPLKHTKTRTPRQITTSSWVSGAVSGSSERKRNWLELVGFGSAFGISETDTVSCRFGKELFAGYTSAHAVKLVSDLRRPLRDAPARKRRLAPHSACAGEIPSA